MKGPDPKTSAGLSDLESAISVGPENGEVMAGEQKAQQDFREGATRAQTVASLRLLWESRRFLGRVAGAGLLLSTLIAFLIPSRYESVARLMPPDNQIRFRPRHGRGGSCRRCGWARGDRKRASGSEEHQRPPGRRPRQPHRGRQAHPEV